MDGGRWVRIIAGRLKGRRLQEPPPGDRAIRPTSDRAREALFSILQTWPRGTFVDLFAGTGAVGLEAWSRGYDPVICVEWDPKAFGILGSNLEGTPVRALRADVRRLSPKAFSEVAVLFGDPPYAASAHALEAILPHVDGWMASDGVLLWEAPAGADLPDPPGWERFDLRRYGAACFHFWRRR